MEPEDFADTPVLMVHPAQDRWTPVGLSMPFFDRIAAPKELEMLQECGHFPVEDPGFGHLMAAVGRWCDRLGRPAS